MSITSIFKKKNFGLLVVALIAVLFIGTKALADWGPNRPTYTWAQPADHITFDSITDNPVVGDERQFLTGKDASTSDAVSGNLTVKDNEEITMRVYFHNNAASNLNLVATNTHVAILLPKASAGAATSTFSTGEIWADNANPNTVWATMNFNGPRPFTLEYEPGTARLVNNVFGGTGTSISDSVVTPDGALVGFNAIDGRVPGCEQFSGYVNIKIRVHMQPAPSFACNLLTVDVLSNRQVHAKVDFSASGGATFKSASFDWGDSTSPTVTTATTADHTYSKDGNFTIAATLSFDVGGTTQTANCTKTVSFNAPPTPEFACKDLSVDVKSNRQVTATVTPSASGGATFKNATFDWGDGTSPLVTNNTTASYTYAKDGTYTIKATLNFNVGGTTESAICSKTITISTPAVTPAVTTKPATPSASTTVLPNTGPGSVVALFAGVSTFAGLFHYLWNSRRDGSL